MRSSVVSLVTSFLLFTIATSSPLLSIRQETELEQETDTLLFVDTMAQFQAARNAQDPSGLDWTSDGCSDSPDNPLGFDFLPACQRHDFGYRNYKAQDRFTDANRLDIDNNFKSDMDTICATYSEESACDDVADLYYDAVRAFGGLKKERAMEN